MVVRVLVVDDSRFFRRRVTEMLESDTRIKVIGSAENGSEAVQKAGRLKPDVITMDIEMPIMDGITATKKIMAQQKIPILMFSSLTTEGAQSTLDALDAGAVDYLPKRFEDISNDKAEARRLLCERVLSVVIKQPVMKLNSRALDQAEVRKPSVAASGATAAHPVMPVSRSPTTGMPTKLRSSQLKLVAIGTSTGGPVALQNVLSKLPANFPLPIILVQHMPGSFTDAFAQRLDSVCAINVRQAKDREVLKAGTALLAPGGKQMTVEKLGVNFVVRVTDGPASFNYKPSVDHTFKSIAESNIGKVLALILTGMGADGCQGSKLLKQQGSMLWAQSEKTCVVAGMPSAVIDAGLTDSVIALDEIGTHLSQRL